MLRELVRVLSFVPHWDTLRRETPTGYKDQRCLRRVVHYLLESAHGKLIVLQTTWCIVIIVRYCGIHVCTAAIKQPISGKCSFGSKSKTVRVSNF